VLIPSVRVVTPPGSEPVSLTEAKAHLRVLHTAEDTLIGTLITAARQRAEAYLGRALITQTRELTLDRWPTALMDGHEDIVLPGGLVTSVTSVKYTNTDGTEATWAGANYVLDTLREPGRITRAYGISWPALRPGPNGVRVRYVVGAATAADVPALIKAGVLLYLGHLYANREAVVTGSITTELPQGVEACWGPYRLRTGAT
jgi:uncharacterized phiE125 gp8 family phage protein